VAPRRRQPSTVVPALSITSEQLVGLIEDVRGTLNRGATAPATLETALAQLEVEALRRNIALPAVPEPRMVKAPDPQVPPDFVRTVLLRSAQSQELQDFADALHHAELGELWFAFQQTREFKDQARLLALQQVAHYLTRWFSFEPDEVVEFEVRRTERLAEVQNPVAWLEHELLRLFHHTLRFGGNPTKHPAATSKEPRLDEGVE
jgi:hypothetical protein